MVIYVVKKTRRKTPSKESLFRDLTRAIKGPTDHLTDGQARSFIGKLHFQKNAEFVEE